MVEAAVVVATHEDLARRVAEWSLPERVDVSWGLVFCHAVPTPQDLRAVREAAKICDRVAVARMGVDTVVAPRFAEVLREAGADIVWAVRSMAGDLRVHGGVLGDGDMTIILQAVLAVLPVVVVVPRTEGVWRQALGQISRDMGRMVTLRESD